MQQKKLNHLVINNKRSPSFSKSNKSISKNYFKVIFYLNTYIVFFIKREENQNLILKTLC